MLAALIGLGSLHTVEAKSSQSTYSHRHHKKAKKYKVKKFKAGKYKAPKHKKAKWSTKA